MRRLNSLALVCLILTVSSTAQRKRPESRDSWLSGEVQYLITEEERAVFSKLTTPEEREHFIEEFWKRRDPNPETAANEFREEFFSRIAYANEHFTAGTPGSKTERGRIYVLYGPPSRVDAHPMGGRYQKPAWQGGDTITTYPFEIWEYNYIPGIGNDITLEFVDRTSTGQYILEMDPNRKDAFFLMRDPVPLQRGFTRFKETPFERLSVWAKLQAPPPLRFPKLKEEVAARVTYAQLPFQSSTGHIKVSESSYLGLLTLRLKNSDLLFYGMNQEYRADAQLYVQVSDMNRAMVYEFDDVLSAHAGEQPLADVLKGQTYYQRFIPLKAGRYKLQLLLRDPMAQKATSREMAMAIPQGSTLEPEASSIILADIIQKAPPDRMKLDPFVLGHLRVVPNLRGYFTSKDMLGLYVEFYNLQLDASEQQPSVNIDSYFCDGKERGATLPKSNENLQVDGTSILFNKGIPLVGLTPGKHRICLEMNDLLAQKRAAARAEFEIR